LAGLIKRETVAIFLPEGEQKPVYGKGEKARNKLSGQGGHGSGQVLLLTRCIKGKKGFGREVARLCGNPEKRQITPYLERENSIFS